MPDKIYYFNLVQMEQDTSDDSLPSKIISSTPFLSAIETKEEHDAVFAILRNLITTLVELYSIRG